MRVLKFTAKAAKWAQVWCWRDQSKSTVLFPDQHFSAKAPTFARNIPQLCSCTGATHHWSSCCLGWAGLSRFELSSLAPFCICVYIYIYRAVLESQKWYPGNWSLWKSSIVYELQKSLMHTVTIVLKDILLRLKGEKNEATSNLSEEIGGNYCAFFIL